VRRLDLHPNAMRARVLAAASAAALMLSLPAALRAQGWSTLPGGDVIFTDTYTTSGTFYCTQGGFAPGSSCVASGNRLTLGNNGAFITLEFVGRTQSIAAGNASVRTELGTLITTVSGTGPFVFPRPLNPNVLTFGLDLRIASTSLGASGVGFGYIVTNPPANQPVNCCENLMTYATFGVPQPPAHYTYRGVTFDRFADFTLRPIDEIRTVSATVGLIPEPSTYVLLGAGLAAMFGVVRRRRSPD
jgi:hypothetical protein